MLQIACENTIYLAVLTDMSVACGTQVISKEHRLLPNREHQIGHGVCAALLVRDGFKAVCQRAFKALEFEAPKDHKVETIEIPAGAEVKSRCAPSASQAFDFIFVLSRE